MTSERIDQLDAPAEVFYRRLMSKVDDHGLYDARPSILRSSLFPLRVDRVREADITRWMAACQKAGVIALYQHDGKPYLQMLDTRWQARSEPKHPIPTENNCKQVQTPVYLFGDGDGVVVEDVKRSSAPSGADGLFDEFWKTYPKKAGKDAARKAFAKRKPSRELLDQMLASIREQVKTDAWRKDGGQYIPHPATWLNEGRWQDETTVDLSVQAGIDAAEATRREREARDKGAGPPPANIRAELASLTKKLTGAMA